MPRTAQQPVLPSADRKDQAVRLYSFPKDSGCGQPPSPVVLESTNEEGRKDLELEFEQNSVSAVIVGSNVFLKLHCYGSNNHTRCRNC